MIYNCLIVLLRVVRIALWVWSIQYLRYLIALKCIVLLMSSHICLRYVLSWVYLGAIHHAGDALSLLILFVVLLERILSLLVVFLIVVILVRRFIWDLWVAHFVLIIFVLLWNLSVIFINIFLFDYLVDVLDLRLHYAHFIYVYMLANVFVEAAMLILIHLVWRLPLLILFVNTVLKRFTIYNHWAL
jgi:hypothetical protein